MRRAPLGQPGDLSECRQIALHVPLDIGTLNLHHDRVAGMKDRTVSLPDRGCCERFPVELGEHLGDGSPELSLQHRLDTIARLGGDTVLEGGELGAQLRWEKVRPGGCDLTNLDIHPTGLFE